MESERLKICWCNMPDHSGAGIPACSRLVCDSLSSTLFFNAARFTLNGKEIRPPVPLGVTDLFNPALPVAELSGGFRTKQIFD